MARRGENIYLRKDGRWEGRYIKGRKENGKPMFGSIYGYRYHEVKRRLVSIKAQLGARSQPVLMYQDGSLAEWLDYWLEETIKENIRETTYDSYSQKIRRHILPYFGKALLREIREEEIVEYQKWLSARLSVGTAQGVFRILRAAFREARKRKLIVCSPFEFVKVPRRQHKKTRFLHVEEQAKIERMSIQTGRIEYVVALYTGLRLGELCALKWEDVDFGNNTIFVRHTLSRVKGRLPGEKTRIVLSAPKSECSLREVPVPVFVMALLRELYAKYGTAKGFVFGKGGRHADPRTVQERFSRMAEKLDIRGAHMHTLRHTFATRCMEQQVGHEVLCELLGHSSPDITYRFYAHCTFKHKQECVERLSQIAG